MSLRPVCTLLVWCCVLSNCVTTKPLWLWAEFLPLDLRCCWINQPMILPGLTPRNLSASHLQTCHWPKTPLSHLRMSILIHVAHQRRRKLTNDSLVILLCCDSVFRGVDPGRQKNDDDLSRSTTWQNHTMPIGDHNKFSTSISGKGELSQLYDRTLPWYNWSWYVCGDTQKMGQNGWYQSRSRSAFQRGGCSSV